MPGSHTFNDGDVGHDVMRWPNRRVAMQTKRKSECQDTCGELTARTKMSTQTRTCHLGQATIFGPTLPAKTHHVQRMHDFIMLSGRCFVKICLHLQTQWWHETAMSNILAVMFVAWTLILHPSNQHVVLSRHNPCVPSHRPCLPQEMKDYKAFSSCSCTYGTTTIIMSLTTKRGSVLTYFQGMKLGGLCWGSTLKNLGPKHTSACRLQNDQKLEPSWNMLSFGNTKSGHR